MNIPEKEIPPSSSEGVAFSCNEPACIQQMSHPAAGSPKLHGLARARRHFDVQLGRSCPATTPQPLNNIEAKENQVLLLSPTVYATLPSYTSAFSHLLFPMSHKSPAQVLKPRARDSGGRPGRRGHRCHEAAPAWGGGLRDGLRPCSGRVGVWVLKTRFWHLGPWQPLLVLDTWDFGHGANQLLAGGRF